MVRDRAIRLLRSFTDQVTWFTHRGHAVALAQLAVAFVAGVVLGSGVALPVPVGAAVAGLCLLAAWRWRRARAGLWLLLSAALVLGFVRAQSTHPTPGRDAIDGYNGRTVQLDGQIAEEPDVRDTGLNLVIAVRRVTVQGHALSVHGNVQVHTSRSVTVEYGDDVKVTGRLDAPRNGAIPLADILARRGIRATMRYPRLVDDGPSNTGVLGWTVTVREHLESGIDAWLPEPEASLLIAITLGARSASLGDLAPLLVLTGLIHIIAISGIKVAMVIGILREVVTRVRGPRLALLVSLPGLWAYVVITGTTVSGVRSAIMWTLVLVAAALGRGTRPLLSLAVAAAGMVALDPTLPWDPAFLLTTIGTVSIVVYTDPLLRAFRWLPVVFREALCVTLAAQVGTLPVVVTSFHVVSLSGPVANALVLPLLPALIVGGFVLGSVAGFAWLAAPLTAVLLGVLHGITLLVQVLSGLPDIPLSSFPLGLSLLFYAALAALAREVLKNSEGRSPEPPGDASRVLLIAVLVAGTAAVVPAVHADAVSGARLLPVGEGSAYLLRSGDGVALLGGSTHPLRLLQRLGRSMPYGRRALDLVVVTDPREVAGLDAVLQHYEVGEVLDMGETYPTVTYARWRAHLRQRGVPVYALRAGTRVEIGLASLTALAPRWLYPDPRDSEPVLRIVTPGRIYLFLNEAGWREQEELVFGTASLRSDVLVVAGHAGIDKRLLRRISPRAVWTAP